MYVATPPLVCVAVAASAVTWTSAMNTCTLKATWSSGDTGKPLTVIDALAVSLPRMLAPIVAVTM